MICVIFNKLLTGIGYPATNQTTPPNANTMQSNKQFNVPVNLSSSTGSLQSLQSQPPQQGQMMQGQPGQMPGGGQVQGQGQGQGQVQGQMQGQGQVQGISDSGVERVVGKFAARKVM